MGKLAKGGDSAELADQNQNQRILHVYFTL